MSNFLAALKAGSWAPALNALIMIGVTVGVETTDQANALIAVVGGAGSLVSLVVAAVHSFRGVRLVKAARPAHRIVR